MRIRAGSFEEADRKVKSGEWQLHAFPQGFLITEIRQYERERVLVVQLLSGVCFEQWRDEALARLKVFAGQHGCVAIEALCRLGLEKKLKPLGFKRTRVLLRADI